MAKEALQKIKAALIQYRQERRPARLLEDAIYTVLATLALAISFFLIIRLSGKIFPSLRNLIELKVPSLRVQNFEIISSRTISFVCLRLLRLTRSLVILVIFYAYVSFVLSLFPWTKTFSLTILNHFFTILEFITDEIVKFLPNILVIALIFATTYYILRGIKPFFTAIQRGNLVITGFYPDWAVPTYKILSILIIALAAVVAFPYLPGFDSPAICSK